MKKKLHTRFPATRIKKIMQTDEDVGKIAMAVPLLVSKALELFLQDLCNHTYDVTLSRGAKTVNCIHLKQCVQAFNIFDFLREIVGKVPDLVGSEADDQSATKRRKVVDESSYNDEDMKTTHIGGGRGRRGGRSHGHGGGRIGDSQTRKFEDVSPESSRTLSPKTESPSHEYKSCGKVRDFDLNVGLDENGDSVTSVEGSLSWPSLLGMNEMKIDQDQQQEEASGIEEEEEDYDEE